jgi:hypothetical protein
MRSGTGHAAGALAPTKANKLDFAMLYKVSHIHSSRVHGHGGERTWTRLYDYLHVAAATWK